MEIIAIILIAIYIYLVKARKLSAKKVNAIREFGLVHITSRENAELIHQNGEVLVKASKRKANYSTLFLKRCSYFFNGIPNGWQNAYNITPSGKLNKDFVAITIEGKDITDEMLNNIKYRYIDGAIMFIGDFEGKGYIREL